MKRLLVGIDGSEPSKTALRWAASVAQPIGAEVVALNAWSPAQMELPPEEWEDEHREVQDDLDAAVRSLGADAPATRTEVIDGEPAYVILDRATTEDADLIVVGHRGGGGFLGLRVGSVADLLAHHTTRPLAVITDDPPLPVRRILLGVDGSEGSAAAVHRCASFASALKADVIAVAVYAQQFEIVPEDAEGNLHYVERAMNDDWIAPLRDAGVTVRPKVVHARHVAEALIDAAEEADVQMIVVGTHGVAPIIKLRLGGVAMRVLHSTQLPVVLVPPPE